MKASTVEIETFDKVVWPTWASPKIDGIRLLMHPSLGPVTQSFKPLPNHYVRMKLELLCGKSDLDGEVYAIDKDGTALFNRTQSLIMTREGEPNFRFATFDCFERPDWEFSSRYTQTEIRVKAINNSHIKMLTHTLLGSFEEFLDYHNTCVKEGFEGVVLRSMGGPYKNGKSTLNQGWMLKYKRWHDAEGIVIGFEELYHNENPKEVSLLGLSKRSSHIKGKIAGGTLGALILETEWGELRVGTGFDATTRKEIWDRNVFPGRSVPLEDAPDIGRRVTFKYQKHGMQTLPRFPVFKGFRED